MDELDLTILPPEYALSKEELMKLKYRMMSSYYPCSTENKLLENINEAYGESPLSRDPLRVLSCNGAGMDTEAYTS